MKKLAVLAMAAAFAAPSFADKTDMGGVVYTKEVTGYDLQGDPVYGTWNGTVKSMTVVGYDAEGDAIYGKPYKVVRTYPTHVAVKMAEERNMD